MTTAMMMRRRNKAFTLIEILICLLILGLASLVVGIEIRKMVATHTFSKNLENLMTDLRNCQLASVCDQIDIKVRIIKQEGHFSYLIEADDELSHFVKKKMLMTGIEQVTKDGKLVEEAVIHFPPSGRFKKQTLCFYQKGQKGQKLDMEMPSIFEWKDEKKGESDAHYQSKI